MSYRALLDRYKRGLATEEEKRIVEQDLEKYEAMEEYLSALLEEEFEDVSEGAAFEKRDPEAVKLRKSVNHKLRKMVFSAVLIVFALYLGIFYGISPVVDSFYYNPGKVTVGESENDMSYDLYAISELNLPGMRPSNVLVDRQGFGRYNIIYSYWDAFTGEIYSVNERMERGNVVSSYRAPLYTGLFWDIRYPYHEGQNPGEKKEKVVSHLEALNSVSYISMGIRFEKDLTMAELYDLEQKYPNITFEWAGIRTEASVEGPNDLIGIQLLRSNGGSGLLGDKKIASDYPGFFLLDWLVSPEARTDHQTPVEARAYERHYKSLLQYVIDREEAVGALERRPYKHKFYEEALAYAEEQGVKTYGVLVFGEARDLLELIDGEDIKGLDFNQALVSRRNI